MQAGFWHNVRVWGYVKSLWGGRGGSQVGFSQPERLGGSAGPRPPKSSVRCPPDSAARRRHEGHLVPRGSTHLGRALREHEHGDHPRVGDLFVVEIGAVVGDEFSDVLRLGSGRFDGGNGKPSATGGFRCPHPL